ncbi:amidase family protein [Hoeflea poritis]|uniref:Amidase family protein n=1 Tax=Hoeflea poritis TaxID=2993659 RepID=A0ABT4VHT9_9HYPH|nr:amidase family protein [Hoeflea poritis]MDA4844164.1 amidase family protein [Hoeflea poritis]
MTERPLWQMSACDLADAIAAGTISSKEAVTAAVDRMRERNGGINAVVDDFGDEAIVEAEAMDMQLRQSGPVGPLHGVPVTIKENVDQAGKATPNGVTAFKDVIAPADSPVAANFKKAGAIVIGRTNTPEFSFRVTTVNELHGRTFNPWNDWATAGGSSGGAAAAVMSGMGALAHGNDIAGSLRFPPAATGATSVKPSLGRVPAYNPSAPAERGLLAQLMSVQGVIAREVRDVRLAMRELVRPDPRDPWMVPLPLDAAPLEGPVRVAFTKNTFEFDLDPAVEKALDTARDALVDAGYEVFEVEPPLVREIAHEAGKCLFGEVKALMAKDIDAYGSDTINAIFKDYFEYFGAYEGDDLLRGLARRSHYAREWSLFLEEYPLVLTPFLPHPTYSWDCDTKGVDGVVDALGSSVYGYSMNFVGLPAGNVPANYNDGLPVGIQIVGRRFREDLILDACEAVEQRVGVMAERLFERG